MPATVITSIKAAIDILKGIGSLKTQTEVNLATIQLQDFILDQQDRLSTYNTRLLELQDQTLKQQEEISSLRKEVASRSSYALVSIGEGYRAYIQKEFAEESASDTYRKSFAYYCQHCHEVSGKAITLQPYANGWGTMHGMLFCPSCKSEFLFIPSRD